MRSAVFIGVDPGLTGAIALVSGSRSQVWPMPTVWTAVAGKRRRRICERTLATLWGYAVLGHPPEKVFICLEKVGPIGAMGPKKKKEGAGAGFAVATTNFRLGEAKGMVVALIGMAGVSYEEVPPAQWRKLFAIPKKDKSLSVQAAKRLFPNVKLNKSDDGKAEALLLAEYGRRIRGAF